MTNDFQQELLNKIKAGLKPSHFKAENDLLLQPAAKRIPAVISTNPPPTNNNPPPLLTTTQLLIILGSLIVMVYLLKK